MDHTDTFTKERAQQVKTILVVEDDAAFGESLMDALKEEISSQALLATDGFQALEVLKTFVPHLFILDYHLPKMNGLELYDHLQATAELKTIPMLLISANAPMRVSVHSPLRGLEQHRVYCNFPIWEYEQNLRSAGCQTKRKRSLAT